MAVLTPDGLSRKTAKAIINDSESKYGQDWSGGPPDITIGSKEYHVTIMEGTYDDNYQVSAKEGDIVFLDLVTYGYGDTITWDELSKQRDALDTWARQICAKHHCTYEIRMSANYW